MTVSITTLGGGSTSAQLPRRFAKQFARAMMGQPKVTSVWAPFRLAVIYVLGIGAVFGAYTFQNLPCYLASIVLFGVVFNYGQAALRANRRLEQERANLYATRTASGSGHYPAFSSLALGALGISPRAARVAAGAPGESAELTETTADVPILAFKAAQLCYGPHGKWSLRSTNEGLPHALDAEAICVRDDFPPEKHGPIPRVDCTCGFYALKTAADVPPMFVPLVVELSGRVIVHELGYRAQYQRILSVDLRCRVCEGPADFVWSNLGADAIPMCEEHDVRSTAAWVRFAVDEVIESLGVPLVQIDESAA